MEEQMVERLLKGSKSECGQGIIAIVVAVAAFAVSAFFLYRTVAVANAINDQAGRIESGAVSIQGSTGIIASLVQTEAVLDSIETTTRPFNGALQQIIDIANDIDTTATSVGSSIASINSNARSIGAEITDILATTRVISSDIITINNLLDRTIATANLIKRDTGLIDISLASANVSTCGIGGIALGIVINSSPDETCL
ncbi:MAG: hypothetical protein ACT4OM_03135 [Actinomycetota bacterium]